MGSIFLIKLNILKKRILQDFVSPLFVWKGGLVMNETN